jgi:hypothetical protein
MGDDTASSVNDLPKVTSVLSSEAVSKTEAFDIMVRFLSKHQFQYPGNVNNSSQQPADQSHQDLEQPRFGRIYHFWEDLYHVAETLVVRSDSENVLYPQQQETLRKLRLVAAPLNTEVLNDSTSKIKQEVLNDDNDDYAAIPTQKVQMNPDEVVKGEMIIKQENEEDVQQQDRKSAKKNKKEKKKDKKRKRESTT